MPDKRRLSAFLIGSLLLNAFLLGVILAHFFMSAPPILYPPEKDMPFLRMREAAMRLDKPYQDKVLIILGQKQAKMQKNMEKIFTIMPEINADLTALKFDPTTINAANSKLEAYDKEIKGDMFDTMVSIAQVLPDKQRVEFFRQISPAHHGMHGPPPPM